MLNARGTYARGHSNRRRAVSGYSADDGQFWQPVFGTGKSDQASSRRGDSRQCFTRGCRTILATDQQPSRQTLVDRHHPVLRCHILCTSARRDDRCLFRRTGHRQHPVPRINPAYDWLNAAVHP